MVAGTITKSELGSFSPSQQYAFLFHELVWKGDFNWFWSGFVRFCLAFGLCCRGWGVVGWLVCWFCGGFFVALGCFFVILGLGLLGFGFFCCCCY